MTTFLRRLALPVVASKSTQQQVRLASSTLGGVSSTVASTSSQSAINNNHNGAPRIGNINSRRGMATISAKGSTAIESRSSSFAAEAIALDCAVQLVKSKIFVGPNTLHGIDYKFSVHAYRAVEIGKQWGLMA